MRENTDISNQPRPDDRAVLRSTGDPRAIVGTPRAKQRAQPSLGDPENAPGRTPERRPPSSEDK